MLKRPQRMPQELLPRARDERCHPHERQAPLPLSRQFLLRTGLPSFLSKTSSLSFPCRRSSFLPVLVSHRSDSPPLRPLHSAHFVSCNTASISLGLIFLAFWPSFKWTRRAIASWPRAEAALVSAFASSCSSALLTHRLTSVSVRRLLYYIAKMHCDFCTYLPSSSSRAQFCLSKYPMLHYHNS